MVGYTPTPDYYNDYICHYGVKGMKWGKRKARFKSDLKWQIGKLKGKALEKRAKIARQKIGANITTRDVKNWNLDYESKHSKIDDGRAISNNYPSHLTPSRNVRNKNVDIYTDQHKKNKRQAEINKAIDAIKKKKKKS